MPSSPWTRPVSGQASVVMIILVMLTEKCNEFTIPLWTATLDFKGAFDSLSHSSIWESLLTQGISAIYIDLMSRLYQNQRAAVQCDSRSREFAIQRGTKQGNPISPIIFNAVLKQVIWVVKTKW